MNKKMRKNEGMEAGPYGQTRHASCFMKAVASLLFICSLAAFATDGTLTATYWTTDWSDPQSVTIKDQAIYAGSQPTVIMKFTRTMNKRTASLKGSYGESAAPYTIHLSGGDYDTSRMTDESWLKTHNTLTSSNTTFNPSGNNPQANHSWLENGITYTLLLDSKNAKVNPMLIKKVQLWKTRGTAPFKLENTTRNTEDTIAESKAIVLVEEKENSGEDVSYEFVIENDTRETDHYQSLKSNTTTFFITIQTVDDVTSNNKWNESEDSDFRSELEFGWIRDGYFCNAISGNGIEATTKEGGVSDLKFASNVNDVMPYPDYTTAYSDSMDDLLFGMVKVGPGNEGYPPSRLEYMNSQIKFITVNGIEYFPEYDGDDYDNKQMNDAQSFVWAIAEAQKMLMPLNEPFAVLGINVAGTNGDETGNEDHLSMVKVRIDVPSDSSFDPRRDLANSMQLNDGYQCISLFKDVNRNGIFDNEDRDTGFIPLYYDSGSNELNNSVWTKSGNTYRTTLYVQNCDNNSSLYKDDDGLPKFFIAVCSNPSNTQVTAQPKYGSTFTMNVESVICNRQSGKEDDAAWQPAMFGPPVKGNFVTKSGELGPGYDSIADINGNFSDVVSRPVTIALELKPYVNPQTGYDLDHVTLDPLEADGFQVPVLSINMAGSPNPNVNEKLHSIKVRFASSGFNPAKHLAPLTADGLSGVSIWKDNKAGGKLVGVFDPRVGIDATDPFMGIPNADTCVELAPECLKWYFHDGAADTDEEWDGEKELTNTKDYFFVILKFQNAIELYDNDDYYDKTQTGFTALAKDEGRAALGEFRGYDYFICLRGGAEARDYTEGKRGLDYNDTFGISIVPCEDMLFGYGEDAVEPKALSKATSAQVKATMPVFFSEPNTSGKFNIYGKTALLAFSVVAPADNYSFNHFAFQVIDVNGTFAFSDFVDSGDKGDTCGIALYKDNGDGRFDENTDQRIKYRKVGANDLPKISTITWHEGKLHMIELNLDPESVGTLPTTDENRKADYFLVFQPTKNINVGDKLQLQIWGSDLLGTHDDTLSFGTLNGSTFTLLPNPDGSTRTTPGTYRRFLSKIYEAEESEEIDYNKDSDHDGIPDWWEIAYFGNLTTAGPGGVDGYTDYDNDGLNDYYEYLTNNSPLLKDTDGNGISDADEDPDGDGLLNWEEQYYQTDPNDWDADDDGISDYDEVNNGTSPIHSMSPGYFASIKGTAISADGIDVPFTEAEFQEGMTTWTVEAQVCNGGNDLTGVLFERVLSNDQVAFRVGLDAGRLYVEADTYGGPRNNIKKSATLYPAALPKDGSFHHVAVTWDGGTSEMRLTVDGISQISIPCDYAPVNDWSEIVDNRVVINEAGGYKDEMENMVHREFTMTILKPDTTWPEGVFFDEVRIWKRARTASQVCDAANKLVGPKDIGLARCFRFDDGGETIEDFAHPGWENFEDYALVDGFDADWCEAGYNADMYGIDDENNDGIPDWYESFYGINDPMGDPDGDGLVNLYEYLCGTDPNDRTSDSYEEECIAGDGMTNGEKQLYGLDPRMTDSDGDGISDVDEVGGAKNIKAETYDSDPLNPLSRTENTLKHIKLDGNENGLEVLDANNISKYALESWTLMAWVKPESEGQTATIIQRKVSGKAINYELGLDNGIPYAKFANQSGKAQTVPEFVDEASAIALEAGKWTHLAATYDSNTYAMTLFINGMPVAENIGTKKLVSPAYGDGVADGEFVGASVKFGAGFSGLMDSVRIYNGALESSFISGSFRTAESAAKGLAKSYLSLEEAENNARVVYAANRAASAAELLKPEHVSDRLIVKFTDKVSEKMISDASQKYGIEILKKFELTGDYLVRVPSNLDLAKGIELLRQYDALEYVTPDYLIKTEATPNDPQYSELWGLNSIGAPDIWNMGYTGSKDVVVAVVDTGIDYTHPDLKANLWTNKGEIPDNGIDDDGNGIVDDYYGVSFKNTVASGDPMDSGSHGTHCSGTIGAVGNNGTGVVGVNWKVRILTGQFLHADGGNTSDAKCCFDYAVANGAKVISCSFGPNREVNPFATGDDPAVYAAILAARAKGVLFVCAAGNDGYNNEEIHHYPSDYELDNIISVAAMDSNNVRASFSDYGKYSVDIAAPGVSILSTVPGSYGRMDGTSMATPHVSGVAALLWSIYPNATYTRIRDAILYGGEPLTGWDSTPVSTNSRLSLTGALNYLRNAGADGSLVACFRGNGAVDAGYVLDLTEQELGAGADVDQGMECPLIHKAAFGSFSIEDADSFAEFSGDTDGDGMPDWYEVAVGHDPLVKDGDIDSDGDKLTNYFEYLAGTSPWKMKTDGKTADRELKVAFDSSINYLKAQELNIHPLAETAGYEGYDTDDDGIADKDEVAASTEADNALNPYTDRVLKITGADSYLELPNTVDFALNGDWTVDLWFRAYPELEDDAVLIRRFTDTLLDGDDASYVINYEVGIMREEDAWRPYVKYASEYGERICKAKVTVEADVWAHVGATFNATDSKLTLVIDNTSTVILDCNGYDMSGNDIGLSHIRVGEGFLGEIDAVRIWNIASENFSNYKSASQDALDGKVQTGLVASYIFDDTGVTAQNFAVAKDDWKNSWINAAVLVGDAIEMGITADTPAEGDEPVVEGEDSDEDGLPDEWEIKYFGNLDQDADDDPDGDGLTNIYEFWCGTDPTKIRTDDTNMDGDLDSDNDGVINLDEQYYGTRPDMVDTDDDGYSDGLELGYVEGEENYGYEVSSPLNSLEQPAKDENGKIKGLASAEEIAKVFRMGSDITMTVADNPLHTGRNMAFSFWMRGNMLNAEGTDFDEEGVLPSQDTVFMKRTVVNGDDVKTNYRFTVSSKAIKFQFGQKATTERFTTVEYAPEDGIAANTWYFVSAVAALDAETPYLAINVSTLDAQSGEFIVSKAEKKLADTNNETVSGDTGKLILGYAGKAGFVLDVDALRIWNSEQELDNLDGARDSAESDAVSEFRFDDGGKTAEDFAVATDWMNNWKHAGVLSAESVPQTEDNVGKGMVAINAGAIEIDPEADSDEDGLLDGWEIQYFGNLEQGPDDDPDGDGLTNIYEFWCGTDPTLKKTDGENFDGDRDEDNDGVSNLDEQNYGTRPDMADTDDDGFSDGVELGYVDSEGAVVDGGSLISSPINSLEQPEFDEDGEVAGLVSSEDIAKVFRMGDGMTMTVADNALHSGRNMSFTFWMRGGMLAEGGKALAEDAVLPESDTVFLKRTVVLEDKELANYRFTVSGKAIKFQFGQKATTERFTSVEYAPEDGIAANIWYFVSAVAALDVETPYLAINVSQLDEKTGDYISSKSEKNLAQANTETVSGEFGKLVLGYEGETGLVLDVDNLRIWNSAKELDELVAVVSAAKSDADSEFRFDDGGETAEDFAVKAGWLDDWKTAGALSAASVAPSDETVGKGMVHIEAPAIVIDPEADSDEDGLPDGWEIQYFGNLEQGPDDDPDGDGLTNIYEFWCGTDPTLKKTNGTNLDGDLDADGDGVSNMDEQYFGTRPDMADTDDDGFSDGLELGYIEDEANYGYEISSPINSLEQPCVTSLGKVATDDDGDALGMASEAVISKIFRMDGDITMTVDDNPAHTGRSMSFSFWMRGNMLNGDKTAFADDAELPTTDTVFLKRSVDVDGNKLTNYRFTISRKAIKFQFAQKATTERFTTVQYAPADGIKANAWYFVCAVAALEAETPYLAINVSTLNHTTGKYVAEKAEKVLSNTNADTVTGEEGQLILGHSNKSGLVVDVDTLDIWNYEQNIDDLDVTYEEPVEDEPEPQPEDDDDDDDDDAEQTRADDDEDDDDDDDDEPAAPLPVDSSMLHSQFLFDDGGETVEDFAVTADWMQDWKFAGKLSTPTVKPSATTVGKGMIRTDDAANSDIAPSNPVVEIQTLSNLRNEETGLVEFCYRPDDNDADKNEFDLLTAVILTESTDVAGSTIYYNYYWLKGDRTAGELSYENGEMLYEGNSISKFMLANAVKLDLYNVKENIASGDVITLAVVAVNEAGIASAVQTQTVTVTSKQTYVIPPALEYVSFTPENPSAGNTLKVTVKTVDENCDGYAVIEWFRNGVSYGAERQVVNGIQTVTFTMNGKVGDGIVTEDGDVWHFKAYYEGKSDTDVANRQIAVVRSRAIPPTVLPSDKDAVTKNADGDYISGNYIYRLIGEAYDGETELDGTKAGNKPPTPPQKISLSPDTVDSKTTIIATVSGSRDPNGDLFTYKYQWYVDGEAVPGANQPFYPSDLTVYEINDDGEITVKETTAGTLSSGTYVTVEVSAVDIYGSESTSLLSEAKYVYDDLAELYGSDYETWAYEPNDYREQATRILPKGDWYDVDDDNVQLHYFYKEQDVDWFWFVVPQSMNNRKKLVKFETTGEEASRMYDSMHRRDNDGDPDTQLSLFKQGSTKRLHYCDDYGNPAGYGGTKYARFELELEPGIYYVQVSLASKGANTKTEIESWTPEIGYKVHLGISEIPGQAVPTRPRSVVLNPDPAEASDDLVCTAEGARSVDGTSKNITYYYVWYRNHELVPFGSGNAPSSWGTERYIISQAKNFADKKFGAPNVMPSKYTSEGQVWYCVVYAADSNGYSDGVMSNIVTIGGSEWSFQLGITKKYASTSVGSVNWIDQAVTIGWLDGATFGYDPGCDSALPPQLIPGSTEGTYRALPQGRMYSIGLDNTKNYLNADYRPYGRASSWFIKIEVGDDSAEELVLSWNDLATVPANSVDGLVITMMSQSADGTLMPVEGTTMSMAAINSIVMTESDIANMQTDDNGQKYVVYRVSLGAPDSIQTVKLNAGWNMISFSVSPLNNSVEDVFSDGVGGKYYRGTVYEYSDGQYIVAKNIVPTRGYWVFAPKAVTFNVYGNVETTCIRLHKGWNIAGPVYNIHDFRTAYSDYSSVISPDNIFEFISTASGSTSYKPVLKNGKYPLSVGKAYWIYAERDVELPLIQDAE